MLGMGLDSSSAQEARGASFALGTSDNKTSQNGQKQPGKQSAKAFILDPDELVLGDDDGANASEVDGESEVSSGEDANSDVSLEAYDLQDDEEDLMTKRPLYLRDLTAGLLSDDDREKTEAALNEAEALLRRQPRDLKDKAVGIVQALLRLEDKYSTPQFTTLRSQALATVCALAPTQTLPYMCSQALEREQLLQSRIDVLQAMTSAAQELSERGESYQRPQLPKTLLQEQIESNLKTRTMQSLKTRRWGYRRDPLAIAKRNAFAPLALEFFSPLLFGYVKYVQKHFTGSDTTGKSRSELEQTFLAHLLHALSSFVECSGYAPQTTAMAKCLLEFGWSERANANAEQDPDAGCREAARLLSSLTSCGRLETEESKHMTIVESSPVSSTRLKELGKALDQTSISSLAHGSASSAATHEVSSDARDEMDEEEEDDDDGDIRSKVRTRLPTKSPKKRSRTDSLKKMLPAPASQRHKQLRDLAVIHSPLQGSSGTEEDSAASPSLGPLHESLSSLQRSQAQPAKLMVKDRKGSGMGVPRAHLILNAVKQAPPAKEKSNPRRWSKQEDESLRLAVERSGERNWKAIADQVPGRNHTQCLQRWTKVLKPGLIKVWVA
uniref:Uncharacterized protein n=1 Tax=Hyaloperonospora arabidopsidis (strain Emoy2) TaxID=559515 RepID=M4B5E0_HYAAE